MSLMRKSSDTERRSEVGFGTDTGDTKYRFARDPQTWDPPKELKWNRFQKLKSDPTWHKCKECIASHIMLWTSRAIPIAGLLTESQQGGYVRFFFGRSFVENPHPQEGISLFMRISFGDRMSKFGWIGLGPQPAPGGTEVVRSHLAQAILM